MNKASITVKIRRTLTAMVCVAVSLSAMTVFAVYQKMENAMIDELVHTESDRLAARLSRFGGELQGAIERDMAPSMFVWLESPKHLATRLPPELRALSPGMHRLPQQMGQQHVLVSEILDGRLYVMYDSAVVAQQSRAFAQALATIVAVFSLLALAFSHLVARWISSPLNALTDRLSRWAPGAPHSDLGVAHEADRLMDAFNRVQTMVDARYADQREFSANLHHEVRTPLAVIRSDAELILLLGAHSAATPERMLRITQAVDEITQSLESTYSIAYANTGLIETVNLQQCVQELVESYQWAAANNGLEIRHHVDAAQNHQIARGALMTVMRNIIKNAISHAAPAVLHIQSTPQGLDFIDNGPGVRPQDLAALFERYFYSRHKDQGTEKEDGTDAADQEQATEGLYASGLGLAIAKRVCDIQGWSLQVRSPVVDGHGTCFSLYFAPVEAEHQAESLH